MVKVAIGAFQHETNTYAADVFGLTTRDLFGQVYGQRIINSFTTAKIPIGGFLLTTRRAIWSSVAECACGCIYFHSFPQGECCPRRCGGFRGG